MADQYDVIVIGAGLGGLTAAALIAKSGRKTLLVERNESVGGAASTYRFGDLVVEASLHETSDPLDPIDPKHAILARIGVLDAVEWVPTGLIYEVRGGPVGQPFILPDSFPAARTALAERFQSARQGVTAVLGDMERLAVGSLSQREVADWSAYHPSGIAYTQLNIRAVDCVYGRAELIVKVKEPLPTARKKLRPGQGSREALKEDPHLRYGLNVHAGRVTDRAVADALNLPYADADHSLQI